MHIKCAPIFFLFFFQIVKYMSSFKTYLKYIVILEDPDKPAYSESQIFGLSHVKLNKIQDCMVLLTRKSDFVGCKLQRLICAV